MPNITPLELVAGIFCFSFLAGLGFRFGANVIDSAEDLLEHFINNFRKL